MIKVHFFDVDYTLLPKSSTFFFLKEARQQNVLSRNDVRRFPLELIRYKLGLIHYDFIEMALTKLTGKSLLAMQQVAEECFERRIKPILFTEGIEKIKHLIQAGERVVFATSAFGQQIEPFKRFYGVEEAITSTLEVDPQTGFLTGRSVGKPLFGDNKRQKVVEWLQNEGIEPNEASFYTDSYTDLPLLKEIGEQICVNPDRFLIREAKKNKWEILHWEK
ncbi:MAG: HAD-IB family hydrolase [Spirochaetaceae bacterium]|jgi:HAD superfamily hydrolase (TIGR01490 family)|nr:HAD-IB family hydrolase [Spirochaetaceae bacterium]